MNINACMAQYAHIDICIDESLQVESQLSMHLYFANLKLGSIKAAQNIQALQQVAAQLPFLTVRTVQRTRLLYM